nr:hypothetical protein [Tanacetum cinerariifolium]
MDQFIPHNIAQLLIHPHLLLIRKHHRRIVEGPVTQTVITHNATYQAGDLDAYDSDCDDFSTAKAVLMANFLVTDQMFSLCLSMIFSRSIRHEIDADNRTKVDTSKALDASLVDTESSRTKSKEHDTSNSLGNDAHDDVVDIRPIYDEEPMAEVQTTAEINVFAIGQQHFEQPEFNNEGEVVQNAKECHDTCPLPAIVTDSHIPEHSYQSLEYENSCLKKTVAQFQKDFSRMEAHCVNLELKYQNQVLNKGQQSQFLKEKSNEAKVKHDTEKCVFSANHDSCLTKLLNEVNSRAKVPSNKRTNRNKPVEPISVPNKQERQIPKVHRFSIQKTSVVPKKTMTLGTCLRWKPTGEIFKKVGLRWVPTRKIFASSTTKVDSEPLIGSNADITNQYECEQTLDISAGTLNLSACTSFNPQEEGLKVCLELGIRDHSNEVSNLKLVPNVVPPADKATTTRQALELLFHHHITMLRSTLAPPTCHVEESEGSGMSGARSTSSDSITPLSPNHPLTYTTLALVPILCGTARMAMRVPLAMSPGLFAGIAEVAAMSDSAFRKSEEDEEVEDILDSDSESEDAEDEGPTTEDEDPVAGDEGLVVGVEGPESDGFGLEEEEAVLEGQQRAASVVETTVSAPLGLRYGVLRRRELALEGDHVYSMFEVGQGSGSVPEPERSEKTPPSPEWTSSLLPISPSPSVVPSPISSPMIPLTVPSLIALPMATSTATIPVNEDQFIKVGAQLELYRSILQDHTQHLDAMPPILFAKIDRDVRELYTTSGAVRDEIFSQRYRFRSLKHEQERTAMTFGALWRPVRALEAWAGRVDTRMTDMSRAGILKSVDLVSFLMKAEKLTSVGYFWRKTVSVQLGV